MRFIMLILTAFLVLGLLTIGPMFAPYQVTASNFPAKEAIPIITNATLSSEETGPTKIAFQTSSLSLLLRTDKPVYLTGETVAITVTTNAGNTYVRVLAQLPGGYQETIGSFTTSGTYTLSWPAPSTPGQVKLTCEGQAAMQVWGTCYRTVCHDGDCWFEPYACVQSTTVTGNAFYDIRVFSRVTSISGRVTDTNGKYVPGASISLSTTGQSTTTNNDGMYEFTSYQFGDNYTLINQIPTVTETISVQAIACEPQPDKTVQVQAERGATNANFTLKRSFYPAAIDLSEFTLEAFSGWPQAGEYSTWQNILGITIDGPVTPKKLQYGGKEIAPPFFLLGNKQLFLITKPELGRYLLEIQGSQNTEYTITAAATLNNSYLEPASLSQSIETKHGERFRLMLQQDGIDLKLIKPFPWLLVIIPTVVVVIGGLAAIYFLTGGKLFGLKRPVKAKTEVVVESKSTTTGRAPSKPKKTTAKTRPATKTTKSRRSRQK